MCKLLSSTYNAAIPFYNEFCIKICTDFNLDNTVLQQIDLLSIDKYLELPGTFYCRSLLLFMHDIERLMG